jgi:Glycosyltransferases involved in cell wall biogenesis
MPKKIDILVPVFNEQGNIVAISEAIKSVFANLSHTYEIIFVDDGSEDKSLLNIQHLAEQDDHVKYISFSRNFGKDNALLAGINYSNGDALITMDADLQHPPEMIPQMIEIWEKGNDIVYTYRADRNQHTNNFQQLSSKMFYKVINSLSDVELEDGIADFRLLDRKVVNVFNHLHEDRPFFRGLIKWIGFKQSGLPYTPNARNSGETKYSTRALTRLALQGITSFSTKPLSIAIYLGFTFALLSLLYIPYILISLYYHYAISGWTSLIVTIVFFGGLQLIILGILGIYLGKLFMQTKQRPHFIVKDSNIP